MPDPVAEQEIVIIQGEDYTKIPRLALKQGDGVTAFNLTGWTLTCQFRREPGMGIALTPTVATIAPATDGICELQYTSAQSFALTGPLRYDIFGTHASNGQTRLVEGPVRLSLAITRT
jgi:hypothetical protein